MAERVLIRLGNYILLPVFVLESVRNQKSSCLGLHLLLSEYICLAFASQPFKSSKALSLAYFARFLNSCVGEEHREA